MDDDIAAGDIQQGQIGDCWLIAHISAAAHQQPDIMRSCVNYNNRAGVASVRFYIEGRPLWLLIDDFLPGKHRSSHESCDGKPWLLKRRHQLEWFARSSSQELWPMFLEKAIAKWAGSWSVLDAKSEESPTGSPTGEPSWLWGNGQPNWGVTGYTEARLALTGGVQRSISTKPGGTLKFDVLTDLLHGGVVITAGSKPKEGGLIGSNGLAGGDQGHAYAVLSTFEATTAAGQIQLVKCRNPWGRNGEWNGDWSDESSLWVEHPQIAADVGYTCANDGVFFMSFLDMLDAFERIYCVGNVPGNCSLGPTSEWVHFADEDIAEWRAAEGHTRKHWSAGGSVAMEQLKIYFDTLGHHVDYPLSPVRR